MAGYREIIRIFDGLIASIPINYHIGVHKNMVWIKWLDALSHNLESQIGKHLSLLLRQQINIAGHPHAYLSIHQIFVL